MTLRFAYGHTEIRNGMKGPNAFLSILNRK